MTMRVTQVASPDVVLEVFREEHLGKLCLNFRLRAEGDELVSEQLLDQDPHEVLQEIFREIEKADLRSHLGTTRKLQGIGATLAVRLLPQDIQARILELCDPSLGQDKAAPSFWIISDEPWIPWDLLRLTEEVDGKGPFLGEVFALTRWLWDLVPTRFLPLDRIGLVVPDPTVSGLVEAGNERRHILELGRAGHRKIEPLEACYDQMIEALCSSRLSGLHFTGHGYAEKSRPYFEHLVLEDGFLTSTDLRVAGVSLWTKRPLVFLNSCRSAQMRLVLNGLGGLAEAFLEAGAGALLGTYWSIADDRARNFSEAFYQFFLSGDSIGEAMRQARLWLKDQFPGDPTWLAYTAFAHPLAKVSGIREPLPAPRWQGRFLETHCQKWDAQISSPGAMLRAAHRIVPFHSRDKEIEELRSWCESKQRLRVRLYNGPGGVGKTRLALEVARHMRGRGWRSGFVKGEADDQREDASRLLVTSGGSMFLVIDSAESRHALLVTLFQALLKSRDKGPFRVLLLSRSLEVWWEMLNAASGLVRDLLSGPTTSMRSLGPISPKLANREDTFHRAAQAFAQRRSRPVPDDLPEDLAEKYFEPILMIHMKALGAVEDVELKGEDGVLDWVLRRERRFWNDQARAQGIDSSLVDGIGQVMAAITLAGGSPRDRDAVELLEALSFFRGVARPKLVQISRLLHATYPGEHWINPLQPDILGEHLIERELDGPDLQKEIYDLIFGPRSENPPAELPDS